MNSNSSASSIESTLTFPCEKLQESVVEEEGHVEDEKYSQEVVVGVGGHEDELLQAVDDARLDQLEEDVVAALVGLLVGHPESIHE